MEKKIITLGNIVDAIGAMERLCEQPMSWQKTYWLDKMHQKMQKEKKVYDAWLQQLIEKYKPEQRGNGQLFLKTAEEARAFDKEVEEIRAIEIWDGLAENKLRKVVFDETDIVQISQKDMKALKGFVQFGPEDEEETEPAEEAEDTIVTELPVEEYTEDKEE